MDLINIKVEYNGKKIKAVSIQIFNEIIDITEIVGFGQQIFRNQNKPYETIYQNNQNSSHITTPFFYFYFITVFIFLIQNYQFTKISIKTNELQSDNKGETQDSEPIESCLAVISNSCIGIGA